MDTIILLTIIGSVDLCFYFLTKQNLDLHNEILDIKRQLKELKNQDNEQ